MCGEIKLPQLFIDIQLRLIWRDYSLLFEEIRNELNKPADGPMESVAKLKLKFDKSRLTIEEQLDRFTLEYNTAFQTLLEAHSAAKVGAGVAPGVEDMKSLAEALRTASECKTRNVGLMLYSWLLIRKPKCISDTILVDLRGIGHENVSGTWKSLLAAWRDLQLATVKHAKVEKAAESPNDPAGRLFEGFAAVAEQIYLSSIHS